MITKIILVSNFYFLFVSFICSKSLDLKLNLAGPLDSALLSLDFEQVNIFELPVLIPLVFYLIHSVSAEGSLNCISLIQFRCFFFYLE